MDLICFFHIKCIIPTKIKAGESCEDKTHNSFMPCSHSRITVYGTCSHKTKRELQTKCNIWLCSAEGNIYVYRRQYSRCHIA